MRLIAATAIEHKLAIVASNTKHFHSVKTLRIKAFKPR
jgi:predicted nucleic acid-binding protein